MWGCVVNNIVFGVGSRKKMSSSKEEESGGFGLLSAVYGSSSDEEEDEEEEEEHGHVQNELECTDNVADRTEQEEDQTSSNEQGTARAVGKRSQQEDDAAIEGPYKRSRISEDSSAGASTSHANTVSASSSHTDAQPTAPMMTPEQYRVWLQNYWQYQGTPPPPHQGMAQPHPQSLQYAQTMFSTPLPEPDEVGQTTAQPTSGSGQQHRQRTGTSQSHNLPVAPEVWRHMDKVTKKQLMEAQKQGENGPSLTQVHASDVQGSFDPRQFYEQRLKNEQAKQTIGGKVWNPAAGSAQRISQASRTQKQKHQINHLAELWKSQEKDIQHKEASSRKTKAQTWAKYGW
eukprot:gb/GECG01004762.1/.p1 GENE.gb/GECG01004762.1/~~gb/GECG01004762.1/.p1  ORF type:complete len:344 (+),score=65.41 gb/GECG01004762.1/:1-1032(+)